mmetsp:Transcript_4701/g.19245  ORF Transcript_4701/g.19245 Transcript_4701/m.19245 type:complete len:205 (-) Transcript_4701:1235-1849(-)
MRERDPGLESAARARPAARRGDGVARRRRLQGGAPRGPRGPGHGPVHQAVSPRPRHPDEEHPRRVVRVRATKGGRGRRGRRVAAEDGVRVGGQRPGRSGRGPGRRFGSERRRGRRRPGRRFGSLAGRRSLAGIGRRRKGGSGRRWQKNCDGGHRDERGGRGGGGTSERRGEGGGEGGEQGARGAAHGGLQGAVGTRGGQARQGG